MSNKIKLNEELSRVKEIMGINNESTLSEGLGGLQIAMMAADEAANKISKMLMDEYSHFVGPQQEGGIKWTFMQQFYTSLNQMVLNQTDEEAYKSMGFTKSEDDGRTDYRDNEESVKEKIDAILSTNINPKLNTFIQPVKFKLDQAFAEDIDIYTILEEVKQEMEFQLERANNDKDLSLVFAKIEALLNNEEAGLNENLNFD